jgi:hypothetical protein
VLGPSYPNGGEVGSHIVFEFHRGEVSYGITLHPWTTALRIKENGERRTIRVGRRPAYPQIVGLLHEIVNSALCERSAG